MGRPISAVVASLIAVCGCTFFFICCLSAPIKRSIYFARITDVATGAEIADFGLFGACWHRTSVYDHWCTPHGLGWRLDEDRLGFLVPVRWQSRIRHISQSLAMNLVVVAFTGASSAIWNTAFIFNKRIWSIRVPAFACYIVALLFAWISWAVDMAVTSELISIVHAVSNGQLRGHYGNAIWITLGGAVFLSLGMIGQLWATGVCCFKEREESFQPVRPYPGSDGMVQLQPTPVGETRAKSPQDSVASGSTSALNGRPAVSDGGEMKQRKSV